MIDDLARLRALIPPPGSPLEPGNAASWAAAELALNVRFPRDYRAFIETYGMGSIDEFVTVLNASSALPDFRLETFGETMLAVLRNLRAGGTEAIPYPIHPEPGGLLPWGVTANGDWGYWITDPPDSPDGWSIALNVGRGQDWFTHPGPLARFLADLLDGTVRVPFLPDDFPSSTPTFEPLPKPAAPG